jgi:hypothetical protein
VGPDPPPSLRPWPGPDWYRALLRESIDRYHLVADELTIERVNALVAGLPDLVKFHAEDLMSRHRYGAGDDGPSPHLNVLGHPLLQLPIWVDAAVDERLDGDTLSDILESSLCGYLSVRAEDDYFDGDWDEPKAAMMLSAVFRARHHALLARHVSDYRFWDRFEEVWRGYAEAMLRESELNDASFEYGPDDFERVLFRSQPLELPANAVLSLKGRWELASLGSELVRHLTKATQLFDDFVDAPNDLASGNYTWMVRRLAGRDGDRVLRRRMVECCDQVFAEAADELDRAVLVGANLGLTELPIWVSARKAAMNGASQRLYQALFDNVGSFGPSGGSGDA